MHVLLLQLKCKVLRQFAFSAGEEERGTLQHQVTTVFKCKIRKNKSLLSKVFFEMCNPHAHPISIHDFSHPQTRIILASSSQTSEKHSEGTHTLNQRSKNCSSTSFPFSFKHKMPCVQDSEHSTQIGLQNILLGNTPGRSPVQVSNWKLSLEL